MRTHRTRVGWVNLLPVILAAGSLSFSQVSTPPVEEEVTFRVDTEMVLLSLAVRDSDNLPVSNLVQENFQVLEDAQPQEIVYFEEHRSPQAVVVCIDVSSSMRDGLLEEAKRAALALVEKLNDESQIAIMAFNQTVSLAQPFTDSLTDLRAAIQELEASGGTALLDGLHGSIELVLGHHYKRQVVVLLSDGKDQDSSTYFDQVDRLVAGSGVLIYPIGVYYPDDRKRFARAGKYFQEPHFEQNLNPIWILRHVADLTGGLSFFPQESESLGPVFARIGNDMTHFYQAGYLPAASGEPRFREIDVRLANVQSTSGISLRTRQGYFR